MPLKAKNPKKRPQSNLIVSVFAAGTPDGNEISMEFTEFTNASMPPQMMLA